MASIFPNPSTIFDGSTDFSEAQDYVSQMVSYINEASGCCNGGKSPLSCEVSFMYLAMLIDSPEEENNSSRWQNDVESLYRIIWPFTS